MTRYFKAEFDGYTQTRSSKNNEYKFATFYGYGHTYPTFHSRRDLAERQDGAVAVVEAIEIEVVEFRALTKINKQIVAEIRAARKAEYLAANPVIASLYDLDPQTILEQTQWSTTRVAYFTTKIDSGVVYSETRTAQIVAQVEALKVSA
jgi:hypothetical protein